MVVWGSGVFHSFWIDLLLPCSCFEAELDDDGISVPYVSTHHSFCVDSVLLFSLFCSLSYGIQEINGDVA